MRRKGTRIIIERTIELGLWISRCKLESMPVNCEPISPIPNSCFDIRASRDILQTHFLLYFGTP